MPGFASGFTGGVALTLGVAYLTVLSHERNRQTQAVYLRRQTQLLTSLLEPARLPRPPQIDVVRQSDHPFIELAKDRWNREIENAIRWVQTTDWAEVRDGIEGAVTGLLRRGLQHPREGTEEAEEKARPRIQDTVNTSRTEAQKGTGFGNPARTPKRDGLKQGTLGSVEESSGEGKGVEHSMEPISKPSDDLEHHSKSDNTNGRAGDAARNAINGPVEENKGAIDKIQAAVEFQDEKVKPRTEAPLAGSSELERALHERYEIAHATDKTVEEALEERYKPLDQRDRAALRGL